ncbi:hypothetical protein OG558_23115 [Kribbella sp. NBC_01510]
MDLTLVTSYDASPEEVFAMITDVTFQEQVFERLRARSYDVVVGDSGDDRAVRVHWQNAARRCAGRRTKARRSVVGLGAEQDLAPAGRRRGARGRGRRRGGGCAGEAYR